MVLNVFEVNSESAESYDNDSPIGTLRSGQVANGRPMSLPTWRITTGDPEAASAVSKLLGGEIESWDTKSSEVIEIITDADKLDVILEGLSTSMVLWGRNGKIRECDGVKQKADENGICADCECPADLKEKKAKSKKDQACSPNIGLYFRIVGLEDLGVFKFYNSSWTMAKDIQPVEAQWLEDGKAKRHATIGKKLVEYTNSLGEDIRFLTTEVTLGDILDEEGPF